VIVVWWLPLRDLVVARGSTDGLKPLRCWTGPRLHVTLSVAEFPSAMLVGTAAKYEIDG
jgi:hypothetical protein